MTSNIATLLKPTQMYAPQVISSATVSPAINFAGWAGCLVAVGFSAAGGGFVIVQTAEDPGTGSAPSDGAFVAETGLAAGITGTYATIAFDVSELNRGPWLRLRAVPSGSCGINATAILVAQKGPILPPFTFTSSRFESVD